MIVILQQVVIGLVVLGILVLIHELGHFIAAKMCGIRVLAFSIGFGRPLLKKTIGQTEYRLSAIPFGGYVHMAGEHPEDEHERASDEFTSKPVWQRATVAVAGPAANMVLAMLMLWIVAMNGETYYEYPSGTTIGSIVDSSAAFDAGIRAGDSITAIDGSAVRSWRDIHEIFAKNAGMRAPMSYSAAGIYHFVPAIVGSCLDSMPAGRAGIQAGDSIVTIGGDTMRSWTDIQNTVTSYDSARGLLAVGVMRGGQHFSFDIKPDFSRDLKRYILGIGPVEMLKRNEKTHTLASAFPRMLDLTKQYTVMIFEVLHDLFAPKKAYEISFIRDGNPQTLVMTVKIVSAKDLAGPIGIVQMSGIAALGGLVSILNFMALIGINLAVLNLFPLIITDGGLLLFLVLETIRGKPLSLKAQLMINRVAISLFIALFLFVTINDIQRIPFLYRLIPH